MVMLFNDITLWLEKLQFYHQILTIYYSYKHFYL